MLDPIVRQIIRYILDSAWSATEVKEQLEFASEDVDRAVDIIEAHPRAATVADIEREQ